MTKSDEIKPKITISIDADLLRRIDKVADLRGDARSQVIERVLLNDIAEEEMACELMQQPVVRETVMRLLESPKLAQVVARFVGQEWDAGISAEVGRLRRRGKQLNEETRKGKAGRVSPEGA